MNILIAGESNRGKSNLGDIVKNVIFRLDSDALINTDDPDRAMKTFGKGSNVYNISIRQLRKGESLKDVVAEDQDIIIGINNGKFNEWFRAVYNK